MKRTSIVILCILALLLVSHFAWRKLTFVCDNTGRIKTVSSVFGISVSEKEQSTKESDWFETYFGKEIPSKWHHIGTRSLVERGGKGYWPMPEWIYTEFTNRINEPKVQEAIRLYIFEKDETAQRKHWVALEKLM